MRPQVRISVAVTALVAALAASPVANAQGAEVIIDRGGFSCGVDADEVPGAPEFAIANSTVRITPDGALVVNCYGQLPDGVVLAETIVRELACIGDAGITATGMIVATRGGQVSVHCRFPAGTVG